MGKYLRNIIKRCLVLLIILGMISQSVFSSYTFGIKKAYAKSNDNTDIENAKELTLDEIETVSIAYDVETNSDEVRYYSFTPEETGKYTLYSYDVDSELDSGDPYCNLYDSTDINSSLAYNDDTDGYHFSLKHVLVAGNTYYYKVENYSSGTIFNITLQKDSSFDVYIEGESSVYNADDMYRNASITIAPEEEYKITPMFLNDDSDTSYIIKWTNWEGEILAENDASYIPDFSTTDNSYLEILCEIYDSEDTENFIYQYDIYVELYNELEAYCEDQTDIHSTYSYQKIRYNETKDLVVTAKAKNTSRLSYEWYYNPNSYSSTEDEYKLDYTSSTITSKPVTETGVYTCVVSDGFGAECHVSFYIEPDTGFTAYIDGCDEEIESKTIETHPNIPGTIKVVATADDESKITYKWYKDYTEIEGETGDTLEYEGPTKANTTYYCHIEDGYGNSKELYFYVNADNDLYAWPKDDIRDFTVSPGGSVDLEIEVSAYDMDGLTYEWKVITSDGEEEIENNSPKLTTDAIYKASEISATVRDKYNYGYTIYFNIEIDNNLNVYALGYKNQGNYLSIDVEPNSPFDMEVIASADDTDGLTYNWYKGYDSASLSTESKYSLDSLDKYAQYRCVVKDKYENTKTITFNLYVQNHLTAKAYGKSGNSATKTVEYGDSVELKVDVSATDMNGITYTWTGPGYSTISDATTDTYTINSVTKSGSYQCSIKDKYGNNEYVYFTVKINNNLVVVAKGYEESGNSIYIDAEYEEPLTLSVVATADDTEGITYKWQKDGSDVGEDSDSYTIDSLEGACDCTCSVTDKYNNTQYIFFHISVANNLKVSLEGETTSGNSYTLYVDPDEELTFNTIVTADDTEGITYEWYKNWDRLPETSSSYTTKPITEQTDYYCKVTDKYGNEKYIYIYVYINNNLTAYWDVEGYDESTFLSITSSYNDTVNLKVDANANDTDGITYKWYGNDGYLITDEGDSYTTEPITQYTCIRCEVSDNYGNTVYLDIGISVENDLSVEATTSTELYIDKDTSATLGVEVSANEMDGITYEWYKDEYLIEGADSDEYTTDSLNTRTTYYCQVKDKYGNTRGVYFDIYINSDFSAYVKGTEDTYKEIYTEYNTSATLEVEATGDGLTYEWRTDSNTIQGVTESSYTTLPITTRSNYYCTVSDAYGNSTSVRFEIGINNNLRGYVKGTTERSTYIYPNNGDEITLSVSATADNTENLTYEWYKVIENTYTSPDDYEECYLVPEYFSETSDTLTTIYNSDEDIVYYLCDIKDIYGNVASVSFYVGKSTLQFTPLVEYKVQVQSFGWEKNYVSNGAISGTVGKAKRLEAIRIRLVDEEKNVLDSSVGSILYKTHIQKNGWEKEFRSNDELSGTVGRALRLEAIQVKLSGDIASEYDVYYQVQAEKLGWLGWAKNGESAGTAGYAYRLEAIRIQLVRKGEGAPSSSKLKPYYDKTLIPKIGYKTQVQTFGWEKSYVSNGATSGTVGKAKRLEAIRIKITDNKGCSGSILYRTHVQRIGWQSFVKDDALSGTVGKALRLEAIQIKLSGDMASTFDVYYRVQAQKFGWMGWAKNGESAGTAGYAYRLEAIQIQLVYKGTVAPGSTANAFRKK